MPCLSAAQCSRAQAGKDPPNEAFGCGMRGQVFCCTQEKLRLKARQERFKDQLDKLPVSATGNSKPTATSASDLEAKKKVSPRPECLGSNTVRLRDIWPVAKLAGRSTYSCRNLQNHVLCDSWRALRRLELSDLVSKPDAASLLHMGGRLSSLIDAIIMNIMAAVRYSRELLFLQSSQWLTDLGCGLS